MDVNVNLPTGQVDDDAFEEEGSTEYNMRELIDQVYEHRDLIVTIPSDQFEILKQGLITRKAKDNAKLRNSGIIAMGDVLSFFVYAAKDATGKELPGISDVRIKLGPKKSVQVMGIKIPANEF